MKFSMKRNESGFSLVELMVVVGIIGILASLALPKLQVFMAKSKQAEAKVSLGAHNTMQQAYYADNNAYGSAAQVGWTAPANSRYAITTPATPDGSGVATSDKTVATAKICSTQAANDVWTMNINKILCNNTATAAAAATDCSGITATALTISTVCP